MHSLTVKEIVETIEQFAPPACQESWDNSGLLLGDLHQRIEAALITIDVTEKVVDEAIENHCGLILSHHPLIFSGIKRINGKTDSERAIIKAIQHHMAIYSAHTSIDVVGQGVSFRMAHKLNLQDVKVLAPQKGLLKKLVVFVPVSHTEGVRQAIFDAGAGQIGQYDSCSFNTNGSGTFRGGPLSNPFVGDKGVLHTEAETRIETIFPAWLQNRVVKAMIEAHPYEEVAYDIYPLDNLHPQVGLGVIGRLPEPVDAIGFLTQVKAIFNCPAVKYTLPHKNHVSTIALCGGSGSTLIRDALAAGADIFLTGDLKYHQFFEAENRMILADIGHYESEQFTKELFFEIVTNKFPKFALRLSQVQTNPVNYLF